MRTALEQSSDDGPRAVLELAAPEGAALADALSFYLRRRFGTDELELSAEALSLRSLAGVSDRLGALVAADLGGRLILTGQELRGLREALCLYLAERDTESYQPPPERERLGELHALNEPLGDLVAQLASPPRAAPVALR